MNVADSIPTSPAGVARWGIYSVQVRGLGVRFVVRESDHANGFGDSMHESIELAESYAKSAQAREAANAAYAERTRAAEALRQQAEAAARAMYDDTDGFADSMPPLQRGKAIAALNKLVRIDGFAGTIKLHVRRMVRAGNVELTERTENKIKAWSRRQWNRADGREQAEHVRKVAEAGTKSVYRINGYDLGKIAFDYAVYLNNRMAEMGGASC